MKCVPAIATKADSQFSFNHSNGHNGNIIWCDIILDQSAHDTIPDKCTDFHMKWSNYNCVWRAQRKETSPHPHAFRRLCLNFLASKRFQLFEIQNLEWKKRPEWIKLLFLMILFARYPNKLAPTISLGTWIILLWWNISSALNQHSTRFNYFENQSFVAPLKICI